MGGSMLSYRTLCRRRTWVGPTLTALVLSAMVLPGGPLAPKEVAAAPGETHRVSVDAAGLESNAASQWPAPSADGRFVAFASDATNLVSGDTNAASDVFVKDTVTGAVQRVDVHGLGNEADRGAIAPVSISGDGRYVAFMSNSTNLVAGDTNGFADMFVRDRVANTTVRASVATDGTQGNSAVQLGGISRNGLFVVFESDASNMVPSDTNGTGDIFVRDLSASTTERVSVATNGSEAANRSQYPSISDDGRYVAFENAGLSGSNVYREIYLRDRQAGTTQLISVPYNGGVTNNSSNIGTLSGDGRVVAYVSQATNIVPNDTNGQIDVFAYDRAAGTTQRLSVASDGTEGNGDSNSLMSLSTDGRFAAFTSASTNLVSSDTNNARDVFIRDRQAGTTQIVSVATDGTLGNGAAQYVPALTADGQTVAFGSAASNLVLADTNGVADIFTHQLGVFNPGPTTFTVNVTDDLVLGPCSASHCSLREAIIGANANPAADAIAFNIPGPSVHTIQPTSPLPNITDPITIDGVTQPGASCPDTLLINLDGSRAVSAYATAGLLITAGSSTVRGLQISHWDTGIDIAGSQNTITCNYIGNDGTSAAANALGIVIESGGSSNSIGGTIPTTRNVISGNSVHGILISGSITSSNVVQGNYIGINASGTSALPNWIGLRIDTGATSNTVGGTVSGARNVISGNTQSGVWLAGAGTSSNTLQGNYIGTDVSGTNALANYIGIKIDTGGSNNTVGGTVSGARNVISGNAYDGIEVWTGANVIQGNYIGTNAIGTGTLGNGNAGVMILGGASNNTVGGTTAGARNVVSGNYFGVTVNGTSANLVQGNYIGTTPDGTAALANNVGVFVEGGATNNTFGGTAAGAGNLIAHNSQEGILATDGVGNSFLGNAIYNNGGLGINLGRDGVTPNDPGDPDTGANNLQNFPTIDWASSGNGAISINGGLNSEAGKVYRLEFFADKACDPSGYGEGERFFGTFDVTTDTAGNASFYILFSGRLDPGEVVTATATETASGNTSELSACRAQPGFIELRKHWSGPAGNVTLKIGTTPGSADVAAQPLVGTDGTTGSRSVAAGPVYVSEQFDAPTNANDYAASTSCFNDLNNNGSQDAGEPAVTPDANNGVTVGSADHVICAFTNNRLPADVRVTLTDAPYDPIEIGHNLTYTITVFNAGPGSAQGVVVIDPIPVGTTLVSASAGGTYSAGNNNVTWNLGAIPSGTSVTLTMTVNVTNLGCTTSLSYSNTVSVTASTSDPNPANNSATETTTLVFIQGTPGDDLIKGTAKSELILGGDGNDTIFGGGGDDVICGQGGNDTLVGDGGNDLIDGGPGIYDMVAYIDYNRAGANPVWTGPTGGWTISLLSGVARQAGGTETDMLLNIENVTGSNYDDTITGDNSANVLVGAAGNDLIYGLGGADNIQGMDGDDILYGGDGNDTISGGAGNDSIHGDAGDDLIRGGPGDDQLFGGYGNDSISGEDGNDRLAGGLGTDWRETTDSGSDRLSGGPGDDLLLGQGGNDIMEGGTGVDRLNGGAGDDRLDGGPLPGLNNVLYGGAGLDTCSNGPLSDPKYAGTDRGDIRDPSCEKPSTGQSTRVDPDGSGGYIFTKVKIDPNTVFKW